MGLKTLEAVLTDFDWCIDLKEEERPSSRKARYVRLPVISIIYYKCVKSSRVRIKTCQDERQRV